jgi:DNA-binding CsgD family transcriptional regulator
LYHDLYYRFIIIHVVDAIFFALLLANFGLGALCLLVLVTLRTEPNDPGVASLALPFFPLLGITALQILEYYLQQRYPHRSFLFVHILYDLAFITIAFSWNYIACHHYHLNGVGRQRPLTVRVMAGVAVLLGVAALSTHLWAPAFSGTVHSLVLAALFYAGIKGVLILSRTRNLYPSSRTAVIIAGISLIGYPTIAAGDILGWRLPFLDPQIPFWIQAHPLYITAITVPLLYFVYQHRQWTLPGAIAEGVVAVVPPVPLKELPLPTAAITARLTTREREILLLLYEGYRYREIAQRLFISLTTVRTHVHHIYEKLDISRKEELFIIMRSSGNAGDGPGVVQ